MFGAEMESGWVVCDAAGPCPGRQRSEIGTTLANHGLAACRELGVEWVVVLGRAGYEVLDDVFVAQELVEGSLAGVEGCARYHAAFAEVQVAMTDRFMFHLAFPVSDLGASERFYVDVLGAKIGRRRADWIDVLLWGHQITLHCRPHEVVREQGKRHFGVVLPWNDWEAFGTRPGFGPTLISHEGTRREQGKIYLEDPDGYAIEIKSYRDVEVALELGGPA